MRATVDESASISNKGDTILITFSGHRLAVEKDRILLDGEEQAKLPEGAKDVDIQYSGGKLSATVDGSSLAILSD